MDHFAPRRRRMAFVLAMTLSLALWPATGGRAALPHLSNEPSGDPGDGVLRPADQNPSLQTPSVQSAATSTADMAMTASQQSVFVLVPVTSSAGQPWSLTFRLVRVDRDIVASWWQSSFGGRWHRAP